jgi:pimeloyl-ACP methyl ester carboxylesterase
VRCATGGIALAFLVLSRHYLPEDVSGERALYLVDAELLGVVRSITVPTLVMNGEKSMDFMHAAAGRIASLVPEGRHTTIKGQAHGVTADATVPVLVEFFGKAQ